MARHVDTYECEWKATHRRPGARAPLPHLRQRRPTRPERRVRPRARPAPAGRTRTRSRSPWRSCDDCHRARHDTWVDVCALDDLVPDRGVCALVGGVPGRGVPRRRPTTTLYALVELRPVQRGLRAVAGHRRLARATSPKVASPVYKQSFDLRTGAVPRRSVGRGRRPSRCGSSTAGSLVGDAVTLLSAVAAVERDADRPLPRRAGRPHRGRALLPAPRRRRSAAARRAYYRDLIPLDAARARASSTRSRSTSTRARLQGVRRRLPQPQRPRRRRVVARRSALLIGGTRDGAAASRR